ncbi:nuclear transport factor 2 family protein [Chondromyces crocatus]|uniref:SnoaL-like domain-containing protein n=1 Tax=Chondromyces crocatus TaxID=52 RepID=A0A0K1EKF1_CHOCO|nr:nuclear transport factor 2 family protein [Chondromyces crocatus]AKT41147.1 uncharacterized protein CMC5_053080 [Chondromyces crocatus]
MQTTTPHLDALAIHIEEIKAEKAIHALKASYIRILDALTQTPDRADELLALFVDDCETEYAHFGKFCGKEALRTWFHDTIPSFTRWSFHTVCLPVLSIDGDTARGSWRFTAYMVQRGNEAAGVQLHYGDYEDVYVRTKDGWRFRSTKLAVSAPPQD